MRGIGLSGATLLVVGSVIGSGIFLTTGVMAQELPSTTLVLAAWAAGGLLAMAGGLTYAEMGSMYPRSGGLYVYLTEAYGPIPGFLFGWACLLVILTGSVAAVARLTGRPCHHVALAADVLRDVELLKRCRLVPTSLLALNLEYLPQTGRFMSAEALAHCLPRGPVLAGRIAASDGAVIGDTPVTPPGWEMA